MEFERKALLDGMAAAAIRAGAAILDVYRQDFAVAFKGDASPVTDADAVAEAIILAALAALAPHVPVIAEEEVAAGRIPATGGCFLLVDPLDGTKEFVERNGDFTVNIALIEEHRPSIGVVYAPVERRLYCGDVARQSAWVAGVGEDGRPGEPAPLRIRTAPTGGLTVVASRAHCTPETDAYLARFTVATRISRGSSLKLCLIAEGAADLYPRLAPTMEWDIAAGDAVLRAAGGMLFGPEGMPMRYGKPRFFNSGFVAAGNLVPPSIQSSVAPTQAGAAGDCA